MSQGKRLCLWDAFGDFRCNATLTEARNPFARPNPERPEWELFTQTDQAGSGSSDTGSRVSEDLMRAGGVLGGNDKEKKENFCGCSASVVAAPMPYSG